MLKQQLFVKELCGNRHFENQTFQCGRTYRIDCKSEIHQKVSTRSWWKNIYSSDSKPSMKSFCVIWVKIFKFYTNCWNYNMTLQDDFMTWTSGYHRTLLISTTFMSNLQIKKKKICDELVPNPYTAICKQTYTVLTSLQKIGIFKSKLQ